MNTKKMLASWPGSWVFVLAAVGSAAGLGNIWRFPYLAYENGGAAFFVAYIICLLLIGFPILLVENAMGQKTRKAAPEAMGTVHKSGYLRFIGFWGVLAAAIVMAYYSSVMSWTISYLSSSLGMVWKNDASVFFFETVLRISENVLVPGSIVPHLFIGLIVVWMLIYYSLFQGMKSIARVVMFITPLPFIFLLALAINGMSLDNAGEGLAFFFFPDWSKLLQADVWIAAASQVFFTLTLGFGVMFAYGALLEKKADLVKSAAAVVLGDTLVAFCAGLAIFSTLGYMAGQQGEAVADVVASGPGLAFVVFPEALALLPYGGSTFAILFFLTLLTLALTSAISLVQSVVSVAGDYFPEARYSILVLAVCSILFFLSIPFTLQSGIYLLDIVDHYIVNYGIVAVGFFEIITIGWIFGSGKLRDYINRESGWKLGKWFDFSLKTLIPAALIFLIGRSIVSDVTAPYEDYDVDALRWFGLAPAIGVLLLAIILGIIAKNWSSPKETD